MIDQLKEFIAIQTIAHDKQSNEAGILFIENLLTPLGFEITLEGNSKYHQPVIIAKHTNPKSDKKIVLYGHYDVEKIRKIDEWETPPFEVVEKENRLFCRGIADNKGILLARILAIEDIVKSGKELPNILWIIQGEEEVAGQTPFEIIPKHFENFQSVLYLEETGIYRKEKPVIFYLPKSDERPSFLNGMNKAIYNGEAAFENRHLNKFTTCPFLTNIPSNGYYLGFGPNDFSANIHRPNESMNKDNLFNHRLTFQKFLEWVSQTNI